MSELQYAAGLTLAPNTKCPSTNLHVLFYSCISHDLVRGRDHGKGLA